jgi:hypothetical protein
MFVSPLMSCYRCLLLSMSLAIDVSCYRCLLLSTSLAFDVLPWKNVIWMRRICCGCLEQNVMPIDDDRSNSTQSKPQAVPPSTMKCCTTDTMYHDHAPCTMTMYHVPCTCHVPCFSLPFSFLLLFLPSFSRHFFFLDVLPIDGHRHNPSLKLCH